MNLLCQCHHITYADFISTLMFVATTFILVVGWEQLRSFNKSKKVEFTYQVDADFADFLNHPDNVKAKAWLLDNKPITDEEDDILRQLFDEFEGIYSLMKQGAINDEVFYDLLSFYVESIYTGDKTPTAKEYIAASRDEARKEGVTRPDEIFIGIERLYDKVKRMEKTRPPEPLQI